MGEKKMTNLDCVIFMLHAALDILKHGMKKRQLAGHDNGNIDFSVELIEYELHVMKKFSAMQHAKLINDKVFDNLKTAARGIVIGAVDVSTCNASSDSFRIAVNSFSEKRRSLILDKEDEK